jgi:hypothetical protein
MGFNPDQETNQELALQTGASKLPEWLSSDSNVDINIVASFLEINHGNLDAATIKKVHIFAFFSDRKCISKMRDILGAN